MKTKEENRSEEAAVDEAQEWWESLTPSGSMSEFRESFTEGNPDLQDQWFKWLQYFIASNMAGRTGNAARCLALMLRKTDQAHLTPAEAICSSVHDAFSRLFIRALLALAEQPSVSLQTVEESSKHVEKFLGDSGSTSADYAILRLNMATRLGLRQRDEDIHILHHAWKTMAELDRKNSSKGEEDDDSNSPFTVACSAFAGQTLVEAFLNRDQSDRAFEVLNETLKQNPCMAPCGMAPQGLLTSVLEPLWESDQHDLFHQCLERLAAAAPVSEPWLAPTGVRMVCYALTGDHDRASSLRSEGEPLLDIPDISPWHKLQFHVGAFRSLKLERGSHSPEGQPSPGEREHHGKAKRLKEQFDLRNGNERGSRHLKVTLLS